MIICIPVFWFISLTLILQNSSLRIRKSGVSRKLFLRKTLQFSLPPLSIGLSWTPWPCWTPWQNFHHISSYSWLYQGATPQSISFDQYLSDTSWTNYIKAIIQSKQHIVFFKKLRQLSIMWSLTVVQPLRRTFLIIFVEVLTYLIDKVKSSSNQSVLKLLIVV